MGPRARRFVAALGTVAFLAFYIWAAIAIADRLPDNLWLDLAFYAVVGLAWSLPLIPLHKWAERGKDRRGR